MTNGEHEKPFFWLPLRQAPDRTAPAEAENHQRLHEGRYSGTLRLGLQVSAAYLHVGGGGLRTDRQENNFNPYHPFATFRRDIMIPGSGIKGPVRALVEAFSNSCIRIQERNVVGQAYAPCTARVGLCPACRLFGSTSRGGRVRFDDAVPMVDPQAPAVLTEIVKIAELFGPNPSPQRKFYYVQQTTTSATLVPERNHAFIEVVPKGRRFITNLHFDNLTSSELGLLLRAMGFDLHAPNSNARTPLRTRFPVTIGGAKPRALGAVKVGLSELRLRFTGENPHYFATLVRGKQCSSEERSALLQTWVGDTHLLDDDAYRQFCELVLQPDKAAPEGEY